MGGILECAHIVHAPSAGAAILSVTLIEELAFPFVVFVEIVVDSDHLMESVKRNQTR